MGEITIHFVGICTHLVGVSGTNAAHRVVLVQRGEDWTVDRYTINPHDPELRLGSAGQSIYGNVVTQFQPQVTLTIEGATLDGPPTYSPSYSCAIPTLGQFAGGPFTLNADVAFNQGAPASVYFDLHEGQNGIFDAVSLSGGANAVRLKMQIGEDAQLVLTPWDSGSPPLTVALADGAIVNLCNESNPASHQDADFLLHYLVTTINFDQAAFPTAQLLCAEPLEELDDWDIGPGCSNSTYP
jgi:hypothetical protein